LDAAGVGCGEVASAFIAERRSIVSKRDDYIRNVLAPAFAEKEPPRDHSPIEIKVTVETVQGGRAVSDDQ
jgi:hypothetical protein